MRSLEHVRVYFLDNPQVVLELKSVEGLLGVHEAQVLTYMRLTNCPVGLLINFNVPRLVDGIRRVIRPGYAELGRTKI
ncbi:MAG: GxxExxY protein [Vicinamibacterales bacterium]